MKFTLFFLAIVSCIQISIAQNNSFIPDSAFAAIQVDFGKVTKSIPIKKINQYDFITSIRNDFEIDDLSDIGVNYSGLMYFFAEDKETYSSYTVSLPIKNRTTVISYLPEEKQKILEKGESIIQEKSDYNRHLEVITLSKNALVQVKVKFRKDALEQKTRDYFESKDWKIPEVYQQYYYEPWDTEVLQEEVENAIDSIQKSKLEIEQERIEQEKINKQERLESKFEAALDSIYESLKVQQIKHIQDFAKNKKEGIFDNNPVYSEVEQETADLKFFIQPSLSHSFYDEFRYFPLRKILVDEMKEMRQFGTANFTTEGLNINWITHNSKKLGAVIKEGADTRINKDLLDYIPTNSQAFAIYNFNTFSAYEELKKNYIPILDKSENGQMLLISAIWSTLDEFVDMEAVGSVYPPNIMVSYGGFKEMRLNKTTYEYDEETFEYSEKDTSYLERIPTFTFAISNEKAYLAEKYIKAFEKMNEKDEIVKEGKFYTIKGDPYNIGFEYYIAIIDNIIIVTNDKNVVENNVDGFSDWPFDKSIYKKAKKAELFYSYLNFNALPSKLIALDLFKDDDKLMKYFSDKTGDLEVKTATVNDREVSFDIDFTTKTNYENGAYFLFDLVNSVYLYNTSEDQ